MVMKQNAMRKNLRQSILKSLGRYIAISAIIALGAGLFVGLLMTKTDMVATGQKYVDEQNMFDLRMVSNYGWSEEYVEKFAALEGVENAEGLIYLDLIAKTGEENDDAVYRFYSIPEKMNMLSLRGGRMPEKDNECLADGYFSDDSILGKTVIISDTNEEDSLDSVRYKTFTIVGYVATPLYMDMNRGTTSIGSGSLENYYFVPEGAFDVDYFTEINLTLEGDHEIYSEEYNDFLDDVIDKMEPDAEKLSEQRYRDVMDEIEEEYNEGYQEYLDGKEEYEEARAEAEQELGDAYRELTDAEEELEENRKQLVNAGLQIENGKKKIDEARGQLYSGLAQAKDGVSKAEAAISAAGMTVEGMQSALEGAQAVLQKSDATAEELAAAQATVDNLSGPLAGYSQAVGMVNALNAQIAQLEQEAIALSHAYDKLMINWGLWGEGRDEIAEGWIEYKDAKAEADEELAEAEAELKDAEEELREAREEIDSMEEPDLIILDRNSNVGYNNLDSSSDIVAGVSRVFPVFFLLIASLVCITTMTRMIDEERTQIGTLKALGYSSGEIISKYLIYSGSGAVLGCGLGLLLGSTIFPQIIWQAYCIMLYIQPNVVLTVDWPLSIAVVVVYLAVMLVVTWYCCNKTLQEEPAELIRPKAPDAGKKIFLEHFPVWQKISFLNKVTIRNIFRYRQRLAMMLVGIGGCTALLVTGFGLRDSIVNVVNYQFEDVTHYDLSVYFREALSEKESEEFFEAIEKDTDALMLYHQSSVELDFDDRVKEIYMISGDNKLKNFIDLHVGESAISLPGADEVVLSVGVAENMGIDKGDTIVLRNADLQELTLTVSGIYDNHVYNYAIVDPDTIEEQWGTAPELQMAFVKVLDGQDVHSVSAAIMELDTVLNVSVSTDLANMVGNMMEALDLVVVVIVFCAGLLAVIVLYNLTNININERIREIATIKVLGFNASETGAYVFKENMVLTVVGSLLGLVFGKFLLDFVMSQVKIDMVWFKAMITPASYIWAVVLTLLSAIVVDFIFYFKLEKINMAEALKSVE